MLILCGETKIISTVRGANSFDDLLDIDATLHRMHVRVVLNSIHDYMPRHEMRAKRGYVSRGGRSVVSVWNRGKACEPDLPWTVYHDGSERTQAVRKLRSPIPARPDICVGVLDLACHATHAQPSVEAILRGVPWGSAARMRRRHSSDPAVA